MKMRKDAVYKVRAEVVLISSSLYTRGLVNDLILLKKLPY